MYQLAADCQGLAQAQFNLGLMHQHGNGVPQDHTEWARLYQLAADCQGLAQAQCTLGSSTTQARRTRRTTPRQRGGTSSQPTRGSPRRSSTSGGCTTRARRFRRI